MTGNETAPGPDALEPMVLNQEMVNKLVAKAGGKISTQKAHEIVEALLEIQMRYYAAIATPELDKANAEEAMMTVGQLNGRVAALIVVGAEGVEHLPPDRRKAWQQNAASVREGMAAMMELFA